MNSNNFHCSFLFTCSEYNESNFQQDDEVKSHDEGCDARDIVHVNFNKEEKLPRSPEKARMFGPTEAENKVKDQSGNHRKPNVVHINQIDFLKVNPTVFTSFELPCSLYKWSSFFHLTQ